MDDVIVVGVDGTSAGRAAVRWSAERASRLGLGLELVHVIDDEWGGNGERQLHELHPEATELVDSALALAAGIAPEIPRAGRVRVGDPMVELAELSRESAMIVVGTHKTGFFHGRALGSRSLQLAAMAWCPVAVIPGFTTALRKNIVVGLDDTAAGHSALAFAAEESSASGEALVLVHAMDEPQASRSYSGGTLVDSLTRRGIATAKELGVTTQIRARDVARPAAEALIDASLQAELLVIGSSRRRGAELSALGATAHDVLMNITGPTVVVHGDMSSSPATIPTRSLT